VSSQGRPNDVARGSTGPRRRRTLVLIAVTVLVVAAAAVGAVAWLRQRAVAENEVELAEAQPDVDEMVAAVPPSWGEVDTERVLDHQGWAIRVFWFNPSSADHCPELERAIATLGEVIPPSPSPDTRCSWYLDRDGVYIAAHVLHSGAIAIHMGSIGEPTR